MYQAHRSTGSVRVSSLLPPYGSSAVEEKIHRQHGSLWFIPFYVSIPGVQNRKLRLWTVSPRLVHRLRTRFGMKRGLVLLCFALLSIIFMTFALAERFGTEEKKWPAPFTDPPTLVFRREDLQRIWKWEISSGHYPSRRSLPESLGLKTTIENPALPPRRHSIPARFKPPSPYVITTRGTGPKRVYLDIQSQPPNVAYPPRPIPGSVADLDIVNSEQHCDFSHKNYVRDCLEVLRVGAGLDNGNHFRRGNLADWKYIYIERSDDEIESESDAPNAIPPPQPVAAARQSAEADNGLVKKRGAEWEPPLILPSTIPYTPYYNLPDTCDRENPRVFHMFWTGPFTDKPYLALLSFLFTQNTGLHLREQNPHLCRPQFWLWINPGPAASVPNPSALHDMYAQLKENPWAAPFLHPRFKDVIQFKLWNTTEQLDGIPELRNEWRTRETLFNSGGHVINVPAPKNPSSDASSEQATSSSKASDDDMVNRLGSKSSSSYDRLSVILSDMARFILCHRYGGIYLDADTIFLRDWEELWGWKGAFAYRWSRLEKYNTAVLHLNKNSALGTFLFRTALKNDLDFHPMTISRYLKEAYLEGLLLRLPDALFDSAWLNTEYYQRERPPQPYFTDFADFFDTPLANSGQPQALGFDGFFKGAFSYHFHNFWWKPFDPARNWPDLGVKFAANEEIARRSLNKTTQSSVSTESRPSQTVEEKGDKEEDQRDLDWSTVLKRTFESYIRGERPNMYGEWLLW